MKIFRKDHVVDQGSRSFVAGKLYLWSKEDIIVMCTEDSDGDSDGFAGTVLCEGDDKDYHVGYHEIYFPKSEFVIYLGELKLVTTDDGY